MKTLRGLLWLPVAFVGGPAQAHSPVPGIEGFYTGLLHPFSTPSQALLMVGLGLLVGGHDPRVARWPLAAFLAATILGVAFGEGFDALEQPMFLAAVLACAFAALLPGRVPPVAIGIAAAGGLLLGAASIPDPGPSMDRVITTTGSFVGANVGLLYLFALAHVIRKRYPMAWVDIAFRVAAAWIGAISLLMLALGFAGVEQPQ